MATQAQFPLVQNADQNAAGLLGQQLTQIHVKAAGAAPGTHVMSGITRTMSFIIPGRGGRGVQENTEISQQRREHREREER